MPAAARTPLAPDARALLRSGACIFGVGALFALLAATVFGGLGKQGPHTNAGWLAIMIAMGCLPFGILLLTLGIAKWLGHRRGR
jgi:hypothetical protein